MNHEADVAAHLDMEGNLTRNYLLEDAMKKSGYDVKLLAKETGISGGSIYFYLRLMEFPSDGYASKIAGALGCKIEDVFPRWLTVFSRPYRWKKVVKRPEKISNRLGLDEVQRRPGPSYDWPSDVENRLAVGDLLQLRYKDGKRVLTYTQREALKLRYGLKGESEHTLFEIAEILGKKNEESASHIINQAIKKLRGYYGDRTIDGETRHLISTHEESKTRPLNPNLQYAMNQAGETVDTLSTKLGIPTASLRAYLYLNRLPARTRRRSIADALRVSEDDIFPKMKRLRKIGKRVRGRRFEEEYVVVGLDDTYLLEGLGTN